MKKLIVSVVMILAFASFIVAQKHHARLDVLRLTGDNDKIFTQADKNALKESLIAIEKQSWEAWQKRDGKFFENFLSDDHVEIGTSGPASKVQIVAFVGSPVCVVKSYKVDKFELTIFNASTALLTYYAEQDTTCNGAPVPSPVWTSSLYVKRSGRWLNALYQHTQASRK